MLPLLRGSGGGDGGGGGKVGGRGGGDFVVSEAREIEPQIEAVGCGSMRRTAGDAERGPGVDGTGYERRMDI